MKKTIKYISLVLVSAFIATSSMAAVISNTANPGGEITVTSTTTSPDLVFTPSTNVVIQGLTQATGTDFAAQSYHNSVVGKNSGKAFGMASDSSAVSYLDISGLATGTAPTAITASDSSAFGADWTKM
jgi:lipoprotein signal peptidase